jgi:hypothetical protein
MTIVIITICPIGATYGARRFTNLKHRYIEQWIPNDNCNHHYLPHRGYLRRKKIYEFKTSLYKAMEYRMTIVIITFCPIGATYGARRFTNLKHRYIKQWNIE